MWFIHYKPGFHRPHPILGARASRPHPRRCGWDARAPRIEWGVERVPRCSKYCKEPRSEEHTSELQSPDHLVCRLLLEKKKNKGINQRGLGLCKALCIQYHHAYVGGVVLT